MLIAAINLQTDIETLIYGIPLMLLTGMTVAVLWALIRPLLRGGAIRRQQDRRYRAHHDKAGNRLPPVARGICQSCQQYAAAVYYLPSGDRFCKKCYKPGRGAKG